MVARGHCRWQEQPLGIVKWFPASGVGVLLVVATTGEGLEVRKAVILSRATLAVVVVAAVVTRRGPWGWVGVRGWDGGSG